MIVFPRSCRGFLPVLALLLLPCPAPAQPANAAGEEFFEKHIRPVLAESCYRCHSTSAEKLKGGLKLDSRAAILAGGESGPSVVPDKPDESLLIKAIRYKDESLQMPPKARLSDEQVRHFEEWVKMGAPFPAVPEVHPGVKTADHLNIAEAKKFWSFQPPREQPLPPVQDSRWLRNPIDYFILAKLEEKGLAPSPAADKRTLIRRATMDLIGLPPTPDEVAAFEADGAPGAFEKVIDRLLASPHYGERWGRYWLDVARYADSKGYVFQEERRYPYAYTYRDWVVKALNDDMPYDRFLMYQIAADQLVDGGAGHAATSSGERQVTDSQKRATHASPLKEQRATDASALQDSRRHLAAMGFLTLGRRFLNNQADIIDDRIDVVTRGTMGMTVACARCHDHKFEAIPTKDYYSLYGVFASSTEPRDLPLISDAKSAESEAFDKELKKIQGELDAFLAKKQEEMTKNFRTAKSIEDHLLSVTEAGNLSARDLRNVAQKRNLSGFMIERWRTYLRDAKDKNDPIFAPWHALSGAPAEKFADTVSEYVQILSVAPSKSEQRVNPHVARALTENAPKTLDELANRYGALLASAAQADPHEDADREALRTVLYATESPIVFSVAETERFLQRDERNKVQAIRQKSDALQVTHPGAPARAMAMVDSERPTEPRVFVRGNAGNLGGVVPRQFLAVLSPDDRKPFTKGSGRLELAQAIADKNNPLTARVMVNRVWLGHFGQGIVRTPSDFGVRGELPTHPQLLDYLAVRFMNEGWSLKRLHKLIMLSAAYQQSSDSGLSTQKAALRVDPENRLLWKMNRRRLDFESLRDSVLYVSGGLDMTLGGKAVDIVKGNSTRRTIYGFIDRQNLPGMFRSFDFASPDQHSPQRFQTTVPQQALFMMNNPFIQSQAKKLVERKEIASAAETAGKVHAMHRILLGRQATPDELGAAKEFIDAERPSTDDKTLTPLQQYAQVLLLTNEFAFFD